MSPVAKTIKPRFKKCGFFVVCPYGPLCHPCGSKEGGKNEKTTLCKTWFFSWFAHTGLYVTPVGSKEGQEISHTKPPQDQKKQKLWTSKCTKPAPGQKKLQKTLQFTWEGASIPLKFCFFVPVQFCCTLKFKTQCIVTCVLWYSIFPLFADYCASTCIFVIATQLFEESGALFMQMVYNLHINLILFRAKFWLQEIGFLSIWNVNILKVIFIQDAFFTVICSVFEHVIIFII